MQLPHPTQPVDRASQGSRLPDSEMDPSRSPGAGPDNGVEPAGYSDCYKLRGPAQQMCLTGYYA